MSTMTKVHPRFFERFAYANTKEAPNSTPVREVSATKPEPKPPVSHGTTWKAAKTSVNKAIDKMDTVKQRAWRLSPELKKVVDETMDDFDRDFNRVPTEVSKVDQIIYQRLAQRGMEMDEELVLQNG